MNNSAHISAPKSVLTLLFSAPRILQSKILKFLELRGDREVFKSNGHSKLAVLRASAHLQPGSTTGILPGEAENFQGRLLRRYI